MSEETFKCSCERCNSHIEVPVERAGTTVECPHCHESTRLLNPNAPVRSGLSISKPDPAPTAPSNPHAQTAPKQTPRSSKPRGKSWLTTFLLAMFLGGFGIDRFYNGRTGLGIGKLLGTILTCGIVGSIWALIDVLLLLFKKYQDAQGNTLRPAKRNHMVIALSVMGVVILLNVIVMASVLRDIKSEVAGFSDTAQRISCVNNLKQVGLSVRQWAMDHSDKYPCNVPTAEGGTLDFCQMTEDGFDANSFRHLQVLSNELNTPKVLVCPADTSKEEASRFETLDSSNVSYLLRSGPEISENNPQEVLAECPIHGTRLYCNGEVKQERNQ